LDRLGRGDLSGGLRAFAALSPSVREQVRRAIAATSELTSMSSPPASSGSRLPGPHPLTADALRWIGEMEPPDVPATMALVTARESLAEGRPELVWALLAPHTRALKPVPDARVTLTTARARCAATAAEEALRL